MGIMANALIEGADCEICGMPFEDGEWPGYPRQCEECLEDE